MSHINAREDIVSVSASVLVDSGNSFGIHLWSSHRPIEIMQELNEWSVSGNESGQVVGLGILDEGN